jgi:Glycosyltransferases involved in cell wall biogenesis
MIILIPAYEPGRRLIKLINELKSLCSYSIVVVDDGSGPAYSDIFREVKEMGCTVLTHGENMGKGRALKTGFDYIRKTSESEGVVTADCDGQHLPRDIIRIAENIDEHTGCIIIGGRRFSGKVPLRSRFGNSVTRSVFSFASGKKLYDTQTGLRGFSVDMLPWLSRINGDRFEYEMNMLLEAGAAGYDFYEIEIKTVYLEQNKSSHFHALKDSARVYWPIMKFSLSSILSGVLDFVLLTVFQVLTGNLLFSVVAARLCSAIFNYTINKILVFDKLKKTAASRSLPRYIILAGIVLLLNYGIIHTYYDIIGISIFFSKVFTEMTIFIFSFWSQRKFVFV